jgi:DNA-directed RNA polymerase specialized sigma24 family protein
MSRVVYEHALGCPSSVVSDAGAASEFQRSLYRQQHEQEPIHSSEVFIMPSRKQIAEFVDAMFEAAGNDEINLRILRLHYHNRLGGKEIAAIVGITPNAVWIRLFRMRESAKVRVK